MGRRPLLSVFVLALVIPSAGAQQNDSMPANDLIDLMEQSGQPQFKQFFPAWDAKIGDIIQENCTQDAEVYFSSPELGPGVKDSTVGRPLIDCILEELGELDKLSMAGASLLLGLLPTILQTIGPTVDDISIVAARRLFLATCVALGMPFLKIDRSGADPSEIVQKPFKVDVLRGRVRFPKLSVWAALTAFESLASCLSAGNIFFLVYELAYYSPSASAFTIQSHYLPKTYPPFVWILLLIPTHILGYVTLRLGYAFEDPPLDIQVWKGFPAWVRRIGTELLPSVFADPMIIVPCQSYNRVLWYLLFYWLTNLSTLVMFLFGTVSLSSQLFIPLGDVPFIVARVVGSCMASRGILACELYGIRRSSLEVLETQQPTTPFQPSSALEPSGHVTDESKEWEGSCNLARLRYGND